MSKVVKGVGKAVGGAAKGAFKGVQKLGGIASQAAPLVGLIPGVGTIAGGALGLGGGLLSGAGIGKSLKRGLLGAGGAFGLSKLGGAKGIASGLGKLFKGAGGAAGSRFGQPGNSSESAGSLTERIAAAQQGLDGGQQGGRGIGGFLSNLFGGGGGIGGALGGLGKLGVGVASLIGAGKDRKSQQEFLDQILQQQQFGLGGQGGLFGAEKSFADRAPLRQQAFSRLQQGLSRAPKGIFGR